ncbi:T9SS type A sorting domain-containing protein [Neolewinella aurantiaca]|uniref:T9SS type A sorting domain-containing protein n=1 Tax=Neolewinella aurantiaca TaxID=2602767 RepID=A0A5C7FPQ1_9BACT|nr:T9SS type A sorting domain-containing protein [Neolewinella aurantiaca]TXF87905.1 T9SS type A sorting domain-containing protein [Neolewinella aurantiaca]
MRILPVFLLLLLCTCVRAQMNAQNPVKIDVNLDLRHSVNGTDSFARERFIVMHENLFSNDWDSDEQRNSFLNDYDVYLGRDNGSLVWQYNQSFEDPARPGYPLLANLATKGVNDKARYAGSPSARAIEHRTRSMMVGGQMSIFPTSGPTNPNACCGPDEGWTYANGSALGEFMATTVKEFYGEGGASGQVRPTMVEVVNEPFYQAGDWGTTPLEIARWHNDIAEQFDQILPEVLVGGYTAAFPELERNDFDQWRDNWKMFMDEAGDNMDFYSVHLYDYGVPANPEQVVRRSGSNIEAVLDMIEHYSVLTSGKVKPWNISEYGYWSPGINGTTYTKERDWHNLRSFSTMMMQLMERPDVMLKTVPFILNKATWWSDPSGNKYPYRLMRQQHELAGETGDEWVYTELLGFFELWKDVRGKRVDSWSPDPDIQADAYVNGNKVYVILNSLEFSPQDIDLSVVHPQGAAPTNIRVKHLYRQSDLVPVLEETTPSTLPSFTLGQEATAVIEYTFAEALTPNERSEERKTYATDMLRPILANQPLTFRVEGLATGAYGEATLRLGIGRDRVSNRRPTLSINGTPVNVPEDYRGYDQNNRDRFFGMLEIPVPYSLLQESNEIVVTFPDNGGHVSSVALQTFAFSREVQRSSGAVGTTAPRLAEAQVLVYPNPVHRELTVTLDAGLPEATLILIDSAGRIIARRDNQRGTVRLNVADFATGVYVLRVSTNAGNAERKVIIR